ncbi:Ribosomal RNA-processing protein 7 A [Clydaea vesicula]|uniref:Ribosomal RNA-processing protein 7 A n=1 Tax=Clydaea vesicula TaxID=447962 RepID=A0AAD5U2R7_9FUNG|nr:Ribosomal RNA-processing protein 7 A [Clydaea vesicula]
MIKNFKNTLKTEDTNLIPLEKLGDYLILPVNLNKEVEHFIYFKKHNKKNSEKNNKLSKTIFLLNLPVDTSKQHLCRLFRKCGQIDNIIFNSKESSIESNNFNWLPLSSGSSCHLTFVTEEGIEKALDMKQRLRVWSDDFKDPFNDNEEQVQPQLYGFTKYIELFKSSKPSQNILQKNVEIYLKAFDELQAEKKLNLQAKKNLPDEDGFITVVSKSKQKMETKSDNKKLKKKKELVDFYRFQMRDTKRQQLADLRTKFEQDKKKIEILKKARKFKPY